LERTPVRIAGFSSISGSQLIRKKLASLGLLKGLGSGFRPSGVLRARPDVVSAGPQGADRPAGTIMIPAQFRLHLGFSIGQFTSL
jgi:hypothetical protein